MSDGKGDESKGGGGGKSAEKASLVDAAGAEAADIEGGGDAEPAPLHRAGWLWKVGDGGLSWKRRWVEVSLVRRAFAYKTDPGAATTLGVVDLSPAGCSAVRDPTFGGTLMLTQFKVETVGRTFHFRAVDEDGEDAVGEWVRAFQEAIGMDLREPGQRVVVCTQFKSAKSMRILKEPRCEPATNQARVRMLFASVSQLDLAILNHVVKLTGVNVPFVPGSGIVGVVDALGPGTESPLTVGMVVAGLPLVGSYAEFMIMPTRELVPVPDRTDAGKIACLLVEYVAAWQMLHRVVHVREGESALVHGGSGAVGQALIALIKESVPGHSPVTVFATAAAEEAEALRAQGVEPLDYVGDWAAALKEKAPEGVDYVFDGIGGEHYKRSQAVLRKGGRLVGFALGGSHGGVGAKLGSLVGGKKRHFYDITVSARKHFDEYAADLLSLMKLVQTAKVDPPVDSVYPMRHFDQALVQLKTHGRHGKILLCRDNEAALAAEEAAAGGAGGAGGD